MVTEKQLGKVGGEAIPTYSTVDKSKKKDENKNKKAAEQKQTEDQYAVVDKSKEKREKKKNELDDTYLKSICQRNRKRCADHLLCFLLSF